MPGIRLVSVCLALALASGADAAPARAIVPGGLTLTELRDWLQEEGYRALIKENDKGVKYIRSTAEGYEYSLDVYGCDKELRCGSVQVYAFFEANPAYDAALAHKWNSTKRWTAMYIDDDGMAVIQQDINIPEISTYEALGENFSIWYMMLRQFGDFLEAAEREAAAPMPMPTPKPAPVAKPTKT